VRRAHMWMINLLAILPGGILEVLLLRRKFQTETGLQFAATQGGHE
jgi:hypothetical protein